jgi:hypothetical protein
MYAIYRQMEGRRLCSLITVNRDKEMQGSESDK